MGYSKHLARKEDLLKRCQEVAVQEAHTVQKQDGAEGGEEGMEGREVLQVLAQKL